MRIIRASKSGSRPWFHSQTIQGWLLVGLAAALTFAALATAGRLPATDLPQHALFLQRMLKGDSPVYDIRWWVPYTLSFWLSMPLARFIGPVESIWTVTAFSVALLPVAAAALATSMRRSPALGLCAYLGAFSTALSWGFSSLVLSCAVFGFSMAAVLRYCRSPSVLGGALLALLMVASYFAHVFGFVVTVFAVWAVLLTRWRRLSLPLLWPAIVATLIDFGLLSAWLHSLRKPWAMGVFGALHAGKNHDFWLRLTRFPDAAVEFGRAGSLFMPWCVLAALFVVALAASAYKYARLVKRARAVSLASRPAPAERVLALGRRFGILVAFVVATILYFTVPMWLGGTFYIYPRFLVIMAVLTPGALLVAGNKGTHRLACFAIVPSLLLIAGAWNETRVNARRTQCVDRLAQQVRPNEAILGLWFRASHAGYPALVDIHVEAELAARRDANTGMDFTDYGAGPVVYQPGYDRLVVPASLLLHPRLYRPDQDGREFTAWLLQGQLDFTAWIAENIGKGPDLQVETCDYWTLVIDRSVEAGGRPRHAFMPHLHAQGACALARHPEATQGLGRFLRDAERSAQGE